ncbi:translocation/assembly module TamB domain-containing protein [Undibacterium jejuense]|uniref:Translocation/assembly module TamB domain-containing protein n=1 Tax=Undibacterium jejuense TaxID=1344949 RepID=A0A923HKS8_9BURK|nr:translocation/assembly module TamB domain-containing protein [Undibacterium jejuense]MBC3860543.1 translocation/assembly module TamB domain-containing protein [Undibacterium jejuense]
MSILLAWAIKTESGTQTLFSVAHSLSAGSLQATGVKGSVGDELEFEKLSYHSTDLKIEASGVHLIWRPFALWHKQALIDRLHVSALLIATVPSNSPASLPNDLHLPLSLSAKDLAVGELLIADLTPGGKQTDSLKLSALTGEMSFDLHQYQARLAFNSPWGRIQSDSLNLNAQRPFALKGNANLQGQVTPEIPAMYVLANASGNLQTLKLSLQAQLNEQTKQPDGLSAAVSAAESSALTGHANATIAPFDEQVLKQLQIDVEHFNPAAWHASAPVADLRIWADAHPDLKLKKQTDDLIGSLRVTNTAVATLDKNALPIKGMSSQFEWRGTRLRLPDLQIQFDGDGAARGDAQVNWHAKQPQAEARIQLSNIDLLKIDQRLRHTQINGEITAQTKENIQVQAQLHDKGTLLNSELNYDIQKQLLTLKQIKLASQDSHVEGQGDISFAGNQPFHFKGSLVNFDPSKWIDVPAGHLQAELTTSGQLLPQLQVALSLPHLQGQYAGQTVQGTMGVQWQTAQLKVHQMDLRWGSNHLNAQGAWGNVSDVLKLQLDAPQLNELNALLANQQMTINGDLKANVVLEGKFSELAGQLNMQSGKLQFSKKQQEYSLENLLGKLSLSHASNGVFDGEISAHHVRSDTKLTSESEDKIEQIKLGLKGRRDAHQIALQLQLPGQQNVQAQINGGLQPPQHGKESPWGWTGQLQSLGLNGQTSARLLNPAPVTISAQAVHVGNVQLESGLVNVEMEQFDWTPDSLKTRGRISNAKVTDLLNFIKPQYAVTGSLKLNADWNIQLADTVHGEINLQKQSGDLRFNDPDGTGTPIPLGIQDLKMQVRIGGLVAGTDGQRMSLSLNADGTRLGQVRMQADSLLSRQNGLWSVSSAAPLGGTINAVVPDLEWVGSLINPGLVLKGKLNLDAKLSGTLSAPHYHANVAGKELEVAFASEGLLLPNGVLDAQIDDAHLKLARLQFSNTVTMLPQHEQFRDWDAIGKRGEFNASGELDIGKETGSIKAEWKQFPMLQRKDRWLQVSGQASIVEANNVWSLNGKVVADGAYFKLPKLPPPSLSSDVNVKRKSDKPTDREAAANASKKGLKTRIDVNFDMGPRFVFVGRGLDTGLAGSLRLRSFDGSPLQATGSINTVKGAYEGYGQQLTIDRGNLNFQGPPANPGLNIRALRKGLPVEAGVEVVGTVVAPQVRLVSEPDVPDTEKLSWLVLGRGSDQLAGGDASLLMSAATAIFGGDGSRNVPKDIVQGLGFDEFSIGNSSGAPSSHVPGQTVAGTTSTSTSSSGSDQVVSVGKHLMPGLVLAVERGLGDASGAVKLSWQLTRRITIVGRTGSESAVDINYTFSFN